MYLPQWNRHFFVLDCCASLPGFNEKVRLCTTCGRTILVMKAAVKTRKGIFILVTEFCSVEREQAGPVHSLLW